MIEAAIFDMGGVLARDVWEYLLPCRMQNGGIRDEFRLEREKIHRIGVRLWEEFAYRSEPAGTTSRELESAYWNRFIELAWPEGAPLGASVDGFVRMTDNFIEPVDPRMPSLLEMLKAKGIDLGLCSNNNEFWFRRQFSGLALDSYFSSSKVILSCRVGVSKSSKGFEMFRAAAQAMNTLPSKCAFVDDRQENVALAAQFGFAAIHFQDFRQLKASFDKLLAE